MELPVSTTERDQKRESRRYFTIVLSDVRVENGIDWHCYSCGYIVLTIFNEPKAGVQVRVANEDVPEGVKVTESLCRKCNIMYRVV
jgi:hypothetical protein